MKVSIRVILSRKGFDSANGGIVSPVFPDGRMLSFPIPSKDINKDSIRYSDLEFAGISLDEILRELGYDFVKYSEYCHLDPDIEQRRRKKIVEGWSPAFGQINQAAGYLRNCQVGVDDLFLFFGNFRHVEMVDGRYCYVRNPEGASSAYYGRPFQAIWGYLQIGKIITDTPEIKKHHWHPHACKARTNPGGADRNNTLYIPRDTLSFRTDLPGCGLFEFDEKRVLTMPGAPLATWKDNKAYVVNRKNSAKGGEGIYYSGIWQELVLDSRDAESWAVNLF